MAIYQLGKSFLFPDPSLAEPEGLLAVGGGLERERLLIGYGLGIFPWYSPGQPILWWSPDPRLVLYPSQIHLSKSLNRVLRSQKFLVQFDQSFPRVMRHCAAVPRPGQDGTWITQEMTQAYQDLFLAGYAHSVECYQEGELVGGLYGVSLGKAFFGESMFSLRPDASKVALAHLCRQLERWGFHFVDCQVPTKHLKSLGAFEMKRAEFLERLKPAVTEKPPVGRWRFDADLWG